MKCTKPAGPYIAILAVLFLLSFATIPTGYESNNKENNNQLVTNDNAEENRLKQIDDISMLR